jgi:hypothetical protein
MIVALPLEVMPVSNELMFVQLPHPGLEARPKGPVTDWNRSDHVRKFLKGTGRYIDQGVVCSGPLVFWGEWEAQSRVVESLPVGAPGKPRYLHEPFWQRPRHRLGLANTDPLVFGGHFLYSNCRQGSNRKLRRLAPGSLILFGSKVAGQFVLDTVFVVGEVQRDFTRATATAVASEDWVKAVVLEPLNDPIRTQPELADQPFRLYQGRTRDERPDGPFSFVPCQPYGANSGFARPPIRLDRRWIEPNLAMAAKATPATELELRAIWDQVLNQVVNQAGLAVAIEFQGPQPADG